MSWRLVLDQGRQTADPSWPMIRQAILEQNGVGRSYTALEHLSGTSMLIAGGGNAGYFVTTFIDMSGIDHRPFTLVQGLTGPDIELLVEGVADVFSAELCVTQDLVLQVFQRYFGTGALPPDVTWKEA